MAAKTYKIIGETDEGEGIDLTFEIPAGVNPYNPLTIHAFAVAALWAEDWTPGSVEWLVVDHLTNHPLHYMTGDDKPAFVGENFA